MKKQQPTNKDGESSEDESDDESHDEKTKDKGLDHEDTANYKEEYKDATINKELELLNADLPQFDPAIMGPDSLCLVVGKRRFGKSVFTRWCMSKMWQYFPDGGYVFTTTKHNWFWQQHFPDTRIYNNFDWGVIDQIKELQLEKWKRRMRTGEKSLDYITLIFDDCISERHDARYAEDLLRLAFNGRHYMLNIWLVAQDIKGFFPDIRANTDYAMLTYQIQERQTETARKDFAGMFAHNHLFSEFLRKNTQDFQLLVIDQHLAMSELESGQAGDGIFSVATADPEPPPFRVGDAQFWADSGCSWEDQLEKWDNIQKSKLSTPERKRLAKERQKASAEFAKHNPQYIEEPFATAGWYAAQGDEKRRLEREALENPGGWTTAQKGVEILDQWINKKAFISTDEGYITHNPKRYPKQRPDRF